MSQQRHGTARGSAGAGERYRSEVGRRGGSTPAGRSGSRRPLVWAAAAIAAVAVAVIAIVAVSLVAGSSGGSGRSAGEAPPEVTSAVSSVPASVFDRVGNGLSQAAPKPISGQPPLRKDGKPQVLYVGAEYCPYCAAERWPLVVALERFGDFKDIGATHSAEGNIATFDFHGASYSSPYLDFTGREYASNKVVDGRYKALDRLTPEEEALFRKYDAPPYVDSASAGSIPFVNFGNRYLRTGATYDPTVLQGLTAKEIAGTLENADDPLAQRIVGSANSISAAICGITNGQPADVCSSAGVKAGRSALGG